MKLPIALILSCFLLLQGCEGWSKKSIAEICQEHPQMCNDLNPDAWCRAEKAEIITHRYQNFLEPHELTKYKLLLDFEAYKKCVGKAAQIEHIKLKEKKSGRVKGYLTAQRELKRLARDTEDSEHPLLLQYHWSRFGSDWALQKFLSYEKTGQLETTELQIALASHYRKFNLDKTVEVLYHALELHDGESDINTDIFKSLSTIFLKQEEFSKAYIWAYVGKKYKIKWVDLGEVEAIVQQTDADISQLRSMAKDYISDIESGRFRAPKV